jgi:hypothetical protein
MGLAPIFAEGIVREHLYRPLTGDVIAIGRQTMFFSPHKALQLVRAAGAPVPDVDPTSLATDTETSLADKGFISDHAFFSLLGVNKLRSLDHNAYEGADLIHDLDEPLPAHLENVADVIIDGSTIDNVFDPAQALMNLSRMLRPGGRLIAINIGSNHYTPYMVPTPGWFFDFFVVNGYADCRVYACVVEDQSNNNPILGGDGAMTVLAIDPEKVTKKTYAI